MNQSRKGRCSIKGCASEILAKRLCQKHYTRQWKGVDPNTPSWYDLSLEERFKSKLGTKDPVTGCIEWVGHRLPFGYGRIVQSGKPVLAHRLAWELKHGPIPEGMQVLHKCDNPPCCNDEHLLLGTNKDNVADREAKGRNNPPKGEAHYRSKLTKKDIADMLQMLEEGKTQCCIAEAFGVSQAQVSRIKITYLK